MSSDYILTLEAIDRRLYSKDRSRPLMRFSASDLSMPAGNHTEKGLSEECLTYMTEILTKHGRPNVQMTHFLFLHFGGWDALMKYIQADAKRRSFLLRCEEKGYSVSSGRAQFDRMLVDGDPEEGQVSASASMRCILEANTLIVKKYCGIYSGKTKKDLRDEIEGFLRNPPEEEKKLVPQMKPADRYAIYRYIRSLLDTFDTSIASGEEESADKALGGALTWLILAALLRDSCRCLCSLLPQNIQVLQVEERESRLSGLPAIASVSQPPRTGRIFKGRRKELAWIGEQFRHRKSPVWITGDGGCGKTSLALQYAAEAADGCCIYAPFHEDLLNTIAGIRFQDRLRWEEISPEDLFNFHLSRITRYGGRLLLIIDNFDAEDYDRTFFEMMGEVCEADPEQRTNGDILDMLCRTGADILFTTRLFVPPQYPSVSLSAEDHLLSRAELTELAKEIYDDHIWTEAEEVMMEEIILSVGKHVMVVELIAAALKYDAGFSTIEEALAKVRSGRYSQIGGAGSGRYRGAPDVYSQMSGLFSFAVFSKEEQLLLRILSLLPVSGIERGLFMELCEGTFRPEVLRGMLLRFRDLHLVSAGRMISMHPVTADLAADRLLPDAANCGYFIRRALSYYEQYTEKKQDYGLLAQVSRLLMRLYRRLGNTEREAADGQGPEEKIGQVRLKTGTGSEQAGQAGADRRAEAGQAGSHRTAETGAGQAERAAAESSGGVERAQAAWKASLIEYETGHPQAALQWAYEAEDAVQRLPASASSAYLSASVCKACGQAESALGRFEEAMAHYHRAIGLQESMTGGGIPDIAITYNDLAVVLYEMEEYGEAEELLKKALGIQTESYGPDSFVLATTCSNLGQVCSGCGEHEKAVEYYEKALELHRTCYGELHPGTAVICCNLGQEFSDLSQMEKARTYFDRALRINTELFGEDFAGNAGICNNVGLLFDELSRRACDEGRGEEADTLLDEAFRWYWKALSILEKQYGTENPHRADLYNNLAEAYLLRGDFKKASRCFETAIAILEKIFGPDHPRTQAVKEDYAAVRE